LLVKNLQNEIVFKPVIPMVLIAISQGSAVNNSSFLLPDMGEIFM